MTTPDMIAGRYELEQRIGHGGMATVYSARDRELGRRVAIKLLADNLAGDEDIRKRFKREARLAAKLDHPNVVQVYDVGEHEDRPYIVMEHVAGGTLADRIEGRGLPSAQALPVLRQMCEGLGHAHDRRLVHRDVKPQNLLLRADDDWLKIADFGIARATEETRLTKTGLVVGTDRYMAPEQLADGRISPATDVYACGVVADETLAGKRPSEFSEIVERCLRDDPGERFTDAKALGEAFESVNGHGAATRPLIGRIPAATDPTARIRQRRPRAETKTRRKRPDRRGGASLVAAFLAGVILIVGVAAAINSGGSDTPPTAPAAESSQPAPQLDDPAEQARAFSAWLRQQER